MAFFIILGLTLPAAAVEDGQVMYFGGTVPALTAGLVGRLDITSETSLTFEYGTSKLVIPYTAVESFEYSTEVTHHLGVLPAIAVGLLKKRERRHFFRISYHDAGPALQVVVFEVPENRVLLSSPEAVTIQKVSQSRRSSDLAMTSIRS